MNYQDPIKKSYTVIEAAAAMGISERSVREEIGASRLLAKRFGSRLIIPASSIDSWLDSLPDA